MFFEEDAAFRTVGLTKTLLGEGRARLISLSFGCNKEGLEYLVLNADVV